MLIYAQSEYLSVKLLIPLTAGNAAVSGKRDKQYGSQ